MRPKGEIYKNSNPESYGEIVLPLSKIERFAYRLLRGIGAGFVGFAIIGLVFAYGPILREEVLFRIGDKETVHTTSKFGALIDFAEADRTARVQREAGEFGVGSHFSIVIPKISASSNVIANVDASNEEEYLDALSKGVAHARGTYFPGQEKNIYLFSHSTDSPLNVTQYNAIFYLLGKLVEGDSIWVYFADKKYEYTVQEIIVTSETDTSWINETGTEEVLVLQTCDPPGTTWRRLLVIAKPSL